LGPNTGTLAKVRAGGWVREGVAPSRCDGLGVSLPENCLKTQMLLVTTMLTAVKFLAFWKLRPRSWEPIHCWGDQSPPVPTVVAPMPHPRIGPHTDAILVCQGPLPLPRVLIFVGLSWLHLSSLSLADLVLSWITEPLSTVFAVILTGDRSVLHHQVSAVYFFRGGSSFLSSFLPCLPEYCIQKFAKFNCETSTFWRILV